MKYDQNILPVNFLLTYIMSTKDQYLECIISEEMIAISTFIHGECQILIIMRCNKIQKHARTFIRRTNDPPIAADGTFVFE